MGRQYPPAVVCLLGRKPATQKYSTVFGLIPFVAPFFSFLGGPLCYAREQCFVWGRILKNDVSFIYSSSSSSIILSCIIVRSQGERSSHPQPPKSCLFYERRDICRQQRKWYSTVLLPIQMNNPVRLYDMCCNQENESSISSYQQRRIESIESNRIEYRIERRKN